LDGGYLPSRRGSRIFSSRKQGYCPVCQLKLCATERRKFQMVLLMHLFL
jgi:hypothetical protein